jgi:hypothetical protein
LIDRVEFKENKVLVHYNLMDTVVGRSYTLRIYSSLDNYLNPLAIVSGDIGQEIKPGPNKKVVWDAKAELGIASNNKVSIELRAQVFIPFIKFEAFDAYKKLSRGRVYNVSWSGGSPQNILNFDLYKGSRKITSFPNVANVGHYKLKLPLYVKPGDGYRFRISDIKNDDDAVNTKEFSVKRKIPLSLQISSLAIIGGVGYFLFHDVNNDLPWPTNP